MLSLLGQEWAREVFKTLPGGRSFVLTENIRKHVKLFARLLLLLFFVVVQVLVGFVGLRFVCTNTIKQNKTQLQNVQRNDEDNNTCNRNDKNSTVPTIPPPPPKKNK